MSRYGSIASALANAQQLRIQSADPTDMQTRLNAALTALAIGSVITAIDLVGAGDGATFLATVTYTPATDPANAPAGIVKGGATSVQVRCWVAGDGTQFGVQRALALTGVTAVISDEITAGASQGTRLMGLAVITSETGFLGTNGGIEAVAMGTALAAGSNLVIGAVAAGMTLTSTTLLFDMPAVGRLRYRCNVQGIFLVIAEISLVQVVSFTGHLDIVKDPAGAPIQQGDGTNYTLVADQKGYVGATAVVALTANEELGLRISDIGVGGSGTLDTARIRAIPISFQ